MRWCPQAKLAILDSNIVLSTLLPLSAMDTMSTIEASFSSPARVPCRLSHLRVIQFTGTEARAFLQTQLSSDLQQLHPDRPQFTTWCKANGRVLTLGWLFDTGASIIWFIPAVNAEFVATQISIYKLRSKVQIALLADWVSDAGEFHLPDGRSIGYCSADLKPNAAPQTPENAWILADTLQLWPTMGGEDRFLPQMLGIERLGGLSLKKGCFPGQEVIARVHYKGEVKRVLARYLEIQGEDARAALESVPGPNADVELVQSATDGENALNVLAVVKKPPPGIISIQLQGQGYTLRLQVAQSAQN